MRELLWIFVRRMSEWKFLKCIEQCENCVIGTYEIVHFSIKSTKTIASENTVVFLLHRQSYRWIWISYGHFEYEKHLRSYIWTLSFLRFYIIDRLKESNISSTNIGYPSVVLVKFCEEWCLLSKEFYMNNR